MPGVLRPSGYDDGEKKERMQDGIWAFITISQKHMSEKKTQKRAIVQAKSMQVFSRNGYKIEMLPPRRPRIQFSKSVMNDATLIMMFKHKSIITEK